MKRRDFLIGSAGVAGSLMPGFATAQAIPCPPPGVAVAGGSAASTACGEASPGEAPAWFTAMADKTWTKVAGGSGQRVSDLAPSPSPGHPDAICYAWNGACVHQAGGQFIMAANGGHTDYYGNEVYSLSLRSATPAWQKIKDTSNWESRVAAGNNGDNHYPATTYNGVSYEKTPPSHHSMQKAVCDRNGNLWYPCTGGSAGGYTYWSTYIWKFDIASRRWSEYGRSIDSTGGANCETSPCAYDPVTNRAWGLVAQGAATGGVTAWYVDCNTGAPTRLALDDSAIYGGDYGRSGWSVICPDLRWLVYGLSNGNVGLINLDNPTSVTRIAFSNSPWGSYGMGVVYHQPSRALLMWDGHGANVLKVAIPTSNPLSSTWAVSTVGPAVGNSVTPSASLSQGTYGRFNVIDDMGNGQSALVLLNGSSQPTYVYKVPRAGV